MVTIYGDGFKRKVLYPGKYDAVVVDGTKVTFHFKTITLNEKKQVVRILDDSKSVSCPMEIIVGKKFKMPIWEECLKSMKVGEICQLDVEKQHSIFYPVISKSYRYFSGIDAEKYHSTCCGMAALREGYEETDLDKLLRKPCDLRFILELLKVEQPEEYAPESWYMSAEEKLASIPKLKEEGNDLYKNKKLEEACTKYAEALNRLEQLMLREKPEDEEWLELSKMKVPLLLNYAQTKLVEHDYYPVIQYTSEVLEQDPKNVKALYKRGKAYSCIWDFQASRNDFLKVLELDSSLKNAVQRELRELDVQQKKKDDEDASKYRGKLFT